MHHNLGWICLIPVRLLFATKILYPIRSWQIFSGNQFTWKRVLMSLIACFLSVSWIRNCRCILYSSLFMKKKLEKLVSLFFKSVLTDAIVNFLVELLNCAYKKQKGPSKKFLSFSSKTVPADISPAFFSCASAIDCGA